ncbi:MAG: PLDc N-terminal domain-containing protein [Coriobacteriia bacterium]|nr:PLDc N-terminal domain-containing protein [Coriobacteriia bacterium]
MEYGAGSDATAGALVALWTSMMCLMYLIPLVLGVASVVVWVIALVDVVQRAPEDFPNARAGRDDPNERMIWLLIVLLVGVIGAVVYYFIVMKPYPRRQPTAAAPMEASSEVTPAAEHRPQADDTA